MDRQNLGQMLKAKLYRQNHTKKLTITQRSLHIDAHKRRKRGKKSIYIKKGRATKSINKSTNDNKL